ncbi:MAG: DUF881 domain-containing protein [Syntrophaceticus sp.]|nr:DUF881 domain-containing protein [Syntrophaceticus sp.]MDD4359633.1 DUF881 domain-containing protein [Syntrophaceticus sp.]MDD4782632.1 DUF881 domain-containing protein [Syntrophaceticus sp.]
MKKNWKLPMTFVMFMIGVLLASALISLGNEKEPPSKSRSETLISMIEAQEKEQQELTETIMAKREELEQFKQGATGGEKEMEALQYELDRLHTLSGISEVVGQGISITLDDNTKGYEVAKGKNQEQVKPDDYLIHDRHLLYIVYDLRAAGAEAISINGERVINSTDIRCAGTTIGVDNITIGPPFVIKAIGDPDKMTNILEEETSQYNILVKADFPVKLKKHSKVNIEAYKGGYQFSYAQPKEEQ